MAPQDELEHAQTVDDACRTKGDDAQVRGEEAMLGKERAADALIDPLNFSRSQRDARRDAGGALGLVVALWTLAALSALPIGEGMGVRFLDLPLCALLAGQGALMAVVLLSVSLPVRIDSVSMR